MLRLLQAFPFPLLILFVVVVVLVSAVVVLLLGRQVLRLWPVVYSLFVVPGVVPSLGGVVGAHRRLPCHCRYCLFRQFVFGAAVFVLHVVLCCWY